MMQYKELSTIIYKLSIIIYQLKNVSNMETVGERVKALRKKHRWSQTDVGEKVKRTHSAIASIERNATAPDDVIQALAKLFKCSEEWLRTGEGEVPKGLVIPIQKGANESPWRDFTIQKMQEEIAFYRKVIDQLTSGKNFLQAPGKAGVAKVVR